MQPPMARHRPQQGVAPARAELHPLRIALVMRCVCVMRIRTTTTPRAAEQRDELGAQPNREEEVVRVGEPLLVEGLPYMGAGS